MVVDDRHVDVVVPADGKLDVAGDGVALQEGVDRGCAHLGPRPARVVAAVDAVLAAGLLGEKHAGEQAVGPQRIARQIVRDAERQSRPRAAEARHAGERRPVVGAAENTHVGKITGRHGIDRGHDDRPAGGQPRDALVDHLAAAGEPLPGGAAVGGAQQAGEVAAVAEGAVQARAGDQGAVGRVGGIELESADRLRGLVVGQAQPIGFFSVRVESDPDAAVDRADIEDAGDLRMRRQGVDRAVDRAVGIDVLEIEHDRRRPPCGPHTADAKSLRVLLRCFRALRRKGEDDHRGGQESCTEPADGAMERLGGRSFGQSH